LFTGISNLSQWVIVLGNGNYTWNCLANDSVGNSDWAENRTILIDYTISPSLAFVSPTPKSGEILILKDYLELNVSFDGTSVNVSIYNSSRDMINSSLGLTSPYHVNLTGLSGGAYHFNATSVREVHSGERASPSSKRMSL